MRNNVLKSFKLSIIFFCLGILALIIGVNGESVAVFISRPFGGSSSWLTTGSMIDGFTYIPMFIGIFFLLLTVITFTISFRKLQKR